jgi:hypothetical protein
VFLEIASPHARRTGVRREERRSEAKPLLLVTRQVPRSTLAAQAAKRDCRDRGSISTEVVPSLNGRLSGAISRIFVDSVLGAALAQGRRRPHGDRSRRSRLTAVHQRATRSWDRSWWRGAREAGHAIVATRARMTPIAAKVRGS